ncbi:MAG: methyltransferase domain-containing protein [Chlorobiota bacterium]
MAAVDMDVNAASYWSERYRRGETGWDLGGETPVLRELLRQQSFPLPPRVNGEQTRVVVPGCGFGHDVILLAREGYDVVGVDFAPEPLRWLADQLQRQGLQAELICEDLFRLPAVWARPADAVWEYTCYCAIDPRRRGEYFATMAGLLRPGGWLVGLFFPLDSMVGGDGPPFVVDTTEAVELAQQQGFRLVEVVYPKASHPARAGREVLLMFQRVTRSMR